MITGNKGEWSEIYVLFRLLADGKIYAADSELNKLENIYFPIIKIIREETAGDLNEYFTGETISIYINNEKVKELPASRFAAEADSLFKEMINKKTKRSFEVKDSESFMEEIFCYKLAAPSTDKSDITMEIVDINTGYSPLVGFSIKSEIGHYATLLNAGKTTNFIFKVDPTYSSLAKETNEITKIVANKERSDIKGRLNYIQESGGVLKYVKMVNQTFKNNLELIDSNMDKIIAETILYFYRDGISDCDELVKKLESKNPMNYGNINAYRYKFKKFLTAVALGMKPATVWDGTDEATGGYIIVTKEGNVLAYHIYNRNYFEEYLLQNTKYETASTTRHDFGKIYTELGVDFIKLNLQVRFK